jgi:hypothetical protein
LNFGIAVVVQTSSARARLICVLTSTGRKIFSTQVGVVAAKKSWLLADDTQDSTLQAPGSLTSAVSTE